MTDGRPSGREHESVPASSESLLVFSDVHLGSDLNDGPGAGARRTATIDSDLVALVAHYRRETPPADRWRIVVAGDFIDFVGIAVGAGADLVETELTEEERRHGLGSALDHARLKLRRVSERHADVFAELGAFVADGHALTMVHGNHDIDFHWDAVKDDFRSALLAYAKALRAEPLDEAAFLERIEFNPWFFYREGVAYIEHGHQYDPFCSTALVMAPLSPFDPRRVVRGFSDVLLRFVVRQTRGMKEHGHEHLGMIDYVTFGLKLGVSGMLSLAVRFVRAIRELFRLRSAYVSEAAAVLRAEHERRVQKLCEAMRIGRDRIDALLALQAPPITSSIAGIMASVLLDRLALAMLSMLVVVGLAIGGVLHGYGLFSLLGVLAAWSLLHRRLVRSRQIDPAEQMQQRASQLAVLFPAAFVVMGHTHIPVQAQSGEATYINVGSWAEEEETEASATPYRAARTHLVIHVRGQRSEAQLCAWQADGPKPLGG
jgi:UDP-2,3-diacylglucosamine pyrophosphatase LpxH